MKELEAELRQSQFEMWEAEKFLSNIHLAKLEKLQKPQSDWSRIWRVAVEMSNAVFVLIGQAATLGLIGHWFLTGSLLP